jgi:outer membrane protein assembly factor BamB
MTVDPEALYLVNKKDEVYALDLDTGSSIWKLTDLLYRQLSAPVVFKGFIVVGDYQGYLHFIDKKTGKIISREHADGDAITAQPLVVNHLLYVLSSDGDLAAFDINP